jgi:tetratricopeptide (TPR) repeat protein
MTDLIEQLSQSIAERLQAAPNGSIEELVERLKIDQAINQRIIQINTDNATGFQTFVKDGGIAHVGVHLHGFDEDKLAKVLTAFWQSLQPSGTPNSVPRSGVVKFIGREDELEKLHRQLQQGSLVAISAVEGMGGVGKTELAIQYTHQYAEVYQGGICWLFARELNIGTQLVGFAQAQLNLKVPEGLDLRNQVEFCWRNWREGGILLVLDDVVNYGRDVKPYLPPSAFSRVKVIMTTRLTFGPPIQSISLEVLCPKQSLELLTILVGVERVQPELDIAKSLCQWLGHLPLGIELVGRYLMKRSDLFLATLLSRLQEKVKRREVLKSDPLKRDEATGTLTAHRGIEAAFDLSWEELDESSQHLGKLLSLFAPAPIPWRLAEAVDQKYFENSPENEEFDVEILEAARTRLIELHLIQLSQKQEQIYRLHSLIREFFRSKLEANLQLEMTQDMGAEKLKRAFCYVMAAVAQEAPSTLTLDLLELATPLIPHFQEATTTLEPWLTDESAILPAAFIAHFYQSQTLFIEAEQWNLLCCELSKRRLGINHLSTADSLNNLALLYDSMGRYGEAEALCMQALAIREKQLGVRHPSTATSLNNLAALYRSMGRYGESELLYVKALAIREKQLGSDDPATAISLNNLAALYDAMGRYEEAEPLYLRALSIYEQIGTDHPDAAQSLNNLANLYRAMGKNSEAEPLFVRALAINEQQLGADHLNTTISRSNLALLHNFMGKYNEAEPLYVRSLAINEQKLGADHPNTATSLGHLAGLYELMGRYSEAEPLYVRALAINEQIGVDHPDTAQSLSNLALLYYVMSRYGEAEPLYVRALAIREQRLSADHPDTAQSLNNLAALYHSVGRYSEAEKLHVRALVIRKQQLGADHPDTAQSLNNLANLYRVMGRYSEAETLNLQALTISEQQSPSHPNTAISMNNLASLYYATGRHSEAEPLYMRALAINEQHLGSSHPNTATSLDSLANLCNGQIQ